MVLRRQQEDLLDGALGHGSYLWSNRDVENALLWFQPRSSIGRSDDTAAAADEQQQQQQQPLAADDEGCEFLRRLLHAPGASICMPRPTPLQSTSKKRRKKNNVSSSSSLLKLSGGDYDHRDGTTTTTNRAKEAQSHPPLQSVLMGYYQLFLASSPSSSNNNNNADTSSSPLQPMISEEGGSGDGLAGVDDGRNQIYQFTDTDIQHASMASSRLLSDLNSIISARKQTNDIYQAYVNVASSRNEEVNGINSECDAITTTTSGGKQQRSSISSVAAAIDEYMTHPMTCTRRVYASSIFDVLLNHRQYNRGGGAAATTTMDFVSKNKNGGGGDDNPELHTFLDNLFILASTNYNIQEVVLLVLLEPARRLQCSATSQTQQCTTTSSLAPRPSPIQRPMSNNVYSQNEQPSHHLPRMEIPRTTPLCTSLWRNVSAETIEMACTSCYPLSLIIQLILSTAPRSSSSSRSAAHSILGDASSAYDSTISTSLRASARDNVATSEEDARIVWWTHPSPLLCTISQVYFPIACKYIQYWIERAVTSHATIYEESSANNYVEGGQVNSDEQELDCMDMYRNIGTIHNMDPFYYAIQRIQQFSSTSDRLNLLCTQSLQTMEKESSSSKTMCLYSEEEEEDENYVFKRSLAWKAIHRIMAKQTMTG